MRIGSGKKVVTGGYYQSYKAWLNRGSGWNIHSDSRKRLIKDCVRGREEIRYAYLLWLLDQEDMKWVNKRL